MKIKATQIRKGMIFIYNNDLNVVTDMQHFTPGKGQAGVQVKVQRQPYPTWPSRVGLE